VKPDDSVVLLLWHATPFRADKFEDHWRPIAEAVLDYGATSWAFLRSKDDPSDFIQMASWRSKLDFDRYWYSEEVAEARAESMGLYQVPVTPQWLRAVDAGTLIEDEAEVERQAQ
jgi:hypothetical protein